MHRLKIAIGSIFKENTRFFDLFCLFLVGFFAFPYSYLVKHSVRKRALNAVFLLSD